MSRWLPIAPFYKRFVVMFDHQLRGSQAQRQEMLNLDVAAAADDPTAIVDEYLNPWWDKPNEVNFSVADGLELFVGKVSTASLDFLCPADLPKDNTVCGTGGCSNYVRGTCIPRHPGGKSRRKGGGYGLDCDFSSSCGGDTGNQ